MFTEIETDVLLEEIAQGDELYESDAYRAIDIWYSVFLKIANESKAMKSTYLYACIRDYWKAMEISGWFDDLVSTFFWSGRNREKEREDFCKIMMNDFDTGNIRNVFQVNLADLFYLQGKENEANALVENALADYPVNFFGWQLYAEHYAKKETKKDMNKAYRICERGAAAFLNSRMDASILIENGADIFIAGFAALCESLGKDEEMDYWQRKNKDLKEQCEREIRNYNKYEAYNILYKEKETIETIDERVLSEILDPCAGCRKRAKCKSKSA